MADKASRRVTDENDGCSADTPRRPRPWVDTVGNTTSGQSDRMSAIEAVTAGIGGDDALNADLLGSLRDTVRHRDFSRHPPDCKSPVNVTTVAPDVLIPAPTRASPSRADNPIRSYTRRGCSISRRSLTSSRNTRVCRKTTQVRCENNESRRVPFPAPSPPRHWGAAIEERTPKVGGPLSHGR